MSTNGKRFSHFKRGPHADARAPASRGEIWEEGKIGALAWKWFATHALRETYLRRRDIAGVNECDRDLTLIEMKIEQLGYQGPWRRHGKKHH